MASSGSDDIDFNFVRFIKFLQNNNIITVVIAAILSDRINEVTNVFFDDIILPIINKDWDGDGESDVKKFEDYRITIFNAKLSIGKLIITIFKFFVVALLLFIGYNIAHIIPN